MPRRRACSEQLDPKSEQWDLRPTLATPAHSSLHFIQDVHDRVHAQLVIPHRPEQHGRVLNGLLCNMLRTVQVKDVMKIGLQTNCRGADKDLLSDRIQLSRELTQPRIKQTLAIRKEGLRALQIISQPIDLAL